MKTIFTTMRHFLFTRYQALVSAAAAGILMAMWHPAAHAQSLPLSSPPAWAKEAIWYQIFVERFNNGDTKNDPRPPHINTPALNVVAPADWRITPWTGDWYAADPWFTGMPGSFNTLLQYRRYGGDLQGVLRKLDHLQNLGVNALFFNPLNDAASLHKYDARSYHHIDIFFGPDPEGDLRIMATEDPADPSTWKWTSADLMFLELVREAHRRGMHVIMDYSWNHVGTSFWAWQDILKNQEKSRYKDWFDIIRFDDPATPDNEFAYKGWANVPSLPEVKKVNVTTTRISGRPYEGDLQAEMSKHIMAVTRRWLAPDGDTARGIDGFRLDVADQIGLGFWRRFRKEVRSIKQDTYLVGEIWWEQWPDQLMDPAPYTQGDIFDAVMFYQVYRPARYFFAKTDYPIDARQFADSLQFQWNRLRPETRYAMMNVSSSHDAPRLLTCFGNPNKYKFNGYSGNAGYQTGKPDAETYKRVAMYLAHLFTMVGAPNIWNGEELGMWGADDPDCRKPLWWPGMPMAKERHRNVQPGESPMDEAGFHEPTLALYKQLIQIRKSQPALVHGSFDIIEAQGPRLVYDRVYNGQVVRVLFNTGSAPQSFALPAGSQWQVLGGKKKSISSTITLPALEWQILQKL